MFGLGLVVLEVPVAYRGWESCHEENNSMGVHSSGSSPPLFSSATIKGYFRDPSCHVLWAVIWGYPKPKGGCRGAGCGQRCGSRWDGRNSTLAPCQRQRALLGAAAFPGTAGSQMVCLSVYMDLWGCVGENHLAEILLLKQMVGD